MYRRPKSLQVLLDIRTAMSEEAGHDIPTFIGMIRTGSRPVEAARTVTREEGPLCEEQHESVAAQPKTHVSRS